MVIFIFIAIFVMFALWASGIIKIEEKPENECHSKNDEYKQQAPDPVDNRISISDAKPDKEEKYPEHDPQIFRKNTKTNNMNCDKYIFSGKYKETGKIRKNKLIYVFEGEDVKRCILDAGYEEPIEYTFEPWPEASVKQKEILYDRSGGKYQENMSLDDASAMIERYYTHTWNANRDLFAFANKMRVPVTYYCNYDYLNGRILHDLSGEDLIAYFAYVIFCMRKNREVRDLTKEPLKETFYEYAKERLADENFDIIKYIHCHDTDDIFKPRTKAFEITKEYLDTKGLL